MDAYVYRKIKQAIQEDGTIMFVGAGISAWSGIPEWSRLLQDMSDFVESCGGDTRGIQKYAKSGPLSAAGLVKDQLTKEQYSSFLMKEMHTEDALPSEIHRLILKLGISCFVTTNYDHLLEKAVAEETGHNYRVIVNTEPQQCANICPE